MSKCTIHTLTPATAPTTHVRPTKTVRAQMRAVAMAHAAEHDLAPDVLHDLMIEAAWAGRHLGDPLMALAVQRIEQLEAALEAPLTRSGTGMA